MPSARHEESRAVTCFIHASNVAASSKQCGLDAALPCGGRPATEPRRATRRSRGRSPRAPRGRPGTNQACRVGRHRRCAASASAVSWARLSSVRIVSDVGRPRERTGDADGLSKPEHLGVPRADVEGKAGVIGGASAAPPSERWTRPRPEGALRTGMAPGDTLQRSQGTAAHVERGVDPRAGADVVDARERARGQAALGLGRILSSHA